MDMRLSKEQQNLVENNLRLVYYVVNKQDTSRYEYDELISIGKIGLCKAACTFKLSKNVGFSTYAYRCIRNELYMFFRDGYKGLVSSVDTTVVAVDTNGKEKYLIEIFSDNKTLNMEDIFIIRISIADVLEYILNNMSPIEIMVLLFTVGNMSQRDIANLLNYSQSYVSRLAKNQRKKLKKYDADTNYERIFKVDVTSNYFEISFCSEKIKAFEGISASSVVDCLQKQVFVNNYLYYVKKGEGTKVVLRLPAEIDSFTDLGYFIYHLQNLSIEVTGESFNNL